MRSLGRAAICTFVSLALSTVTAIADDESDAVDLQTKHVALEKAQVDLDTAKQSLLKSELAITPGSTNLGTGAGAAEESILADQSLKVLAASAAADALADNKCSKFVIYIDVKPTKGEVLAFDIAIDRLTKEVSAANGLFDTAEKDDKGKRGNPKQREKFIVPIVAAVSALGLLKTDYQIGGEAIAADGPQFAIETANQVVKKGKEILFASELVNWPKTETELTTLLSGSLNTLSLDAIAAQANSAAATARAKALDAKPDIATEYTKAAGALTAVAADLNGFQTALNSVDATGTPLLLRVAEEKALETEASYCRLGLHVIHAAGSHYSKSNIATFFGGMPFYSSAYVAASMMVWDHDVQLTKATVETQKSTFERFDEIYPSKE